MMMGVDARLWCFGLEELQNVWNNTKLNKQSVTPIQHCDNNLRPMDDPRRGPPLDDKREFLNLRAHKHRKFGRLCIAYIDEPLTATRDLLAGKKAQKVGMKFTPAVSLGLDRQSSNSIIGYWKDGKKAQLYQKIGSGRSDMLLEG